MPGLKKFKDDLRAAGRRNPQLLTNKLEKLDFSELELSILKYRYIEGLLIKQIAYRTGYGEPWVKKVYRRATLKLLDRLKLADLLELNIDLQAPSRLLYTGGLF